MLLWEFDLPLLMKVKLVLPWKMWKMQVMATEVEQATVGNKAWMKKMEGS